MEKELCKRHTNYAQRHQCWKSTAASGKVGEMHVNSGPADSRGFCRNVWARKFHTMSKHPYEN